MTDENAVPEVESQPQTNTFEGTFQTQPTTPPKTVLVVPSTPAKPAPTVDPVAALTARVVKLETANAALLKVLRRKIAFLGL
jgi:hypothetical protein